MPRRDDVFDDYDGHSGLMDGITATIGETLRERPGTFAAMVTFVALFGFVASNALWHQPNSHESAFYSTRDNMTVDAINPVSNKPLNEKPATSKSFASKPAVAKRQIGAMPLPEVTAAEGADPTIMGVQAALFDLALYQGEVDGVMGSRTRQAIMAYQNILRMPQTGEISDQLLSNLRALPAKRTAMPSLATGNSGKELRIDDLVANAADEAGGSSAGGDIVASIRPSPRPKTENIARQPAARDDVLAINGDPMVMQIQAGLRQYLDVDLVADGQMGSKTRKAIEDFQNIMRLPVTGKIDDNVLDRMRTEGLIN